MAVFLYSAAHSQQPSSKGRGIFRSPAILDNEQVVITAYTGVSTLDNTCRDGLFSLKLQVHNRADPEQQRLLVLKQPVYAQIEVRAEVLDSAGKKVLDLKSGVRQVRGGARSWFELEGRIENVGRWSVQTPSLYQVNVYLKEKGGSTLKSISYTTGFRKIEQQGTGLLLNGEPFELKGVVPGQSVKGERQIQHVLETVKQGNFNTIALTFPVDTTWYKLCDRYGVCIIEDIPEDLSDTGTAGIHHPSLILLSAEEEARQPAVEEITDRGAGRIVQYEHALADAGTFPELPVSYEGEPFPGYFDRKYWQQPFGFKLEDPLKGIVEITNKDSLQTPDNYELRWQVTENGKVVKEGKVDKLEIPAGQTQNLTLGSLASFRKGNDYFLNLSVHTRQAEPLIPAGFEIAADQFNLSPYRYEQEYHAARGGIRAADGPGSIHLSGYDFRLSFNKQTGTITSYTYKGKTLISGGPDLNLRLAPEGMDAIEKAPVVEVKTTQDVNGNYYISFGKELLNGDARFFQKFRIDGRGGILVENSFVKLNGTHPDLLRLGTHFRLPADYKTVQWYGKGPYESFPGRKGAARVGIYQGAVTERNGNKTQVRWLELSRADGYGLLIRGESRLLHMNLEHTAEKGIELDIDFKQTPVPFKSYHYTYRIIPVSSEQSGGRSADRD